VAGAVGRFCGTAGLVYLAGDVVVQGVQISDNEFKPPGWQPIPAKASGNLKERDSLSFILIIIWVKLFNTIGA
jgi:hypothetical protein